MSEPTFSPHPRPMPASGRSGPIVLGVLLIGGGIVLLVARYLDLDVGAVGWPVWIIGPGVVLLVAALVAGGDLGVGLGVAGTVTTIVGLILEVQQLTGLWASWAYAWALIPASIGLTLAIAGLGRGDREMARGGTTSLLTGLVLFAAGFAFFEGVLGVSGRSFPLLDAAAPLALVAIGIALIGWRLVGGRSTD